MKRRKLVPIVGSVCLMLLIIALPFVAACAAKEPTPTTPTTPTPTPSPAPAPTPMPHKVIELKFSTVYPVLHPMNYDAYNVWCKELDKRTNGRTKTTLFGGGTLSPPRENWDSIKAGIADVGEVWLSANPELHPVSLMYLLPFVGPSAAVVSPAIYRFTTSHDELLREWQDVHLLAQHTTAITNLHTSDKLVKCLEDMRGIPLGTDTTLVLDCIKAFGGVPVFVTAHEAYLALEKGVIKGGIYPWAPLRSMRLTEYIKYHTIINLNFAVPTVVMNKERWESLPEDIKDIINDISGINLSALAGYTLTNGSLTDMEYMKEKGDEFYTLPANEMERWKDAVAYTVEDWKAKVAELGVDGEKLWSELHEAVAESEANPYPYQDWWGDPEKCCGKVCSPNRPGGWPEEECPTQ